MMCLITQVRMGKEYSSSSILLLCIGCPQFNLLIIFGIISFPSLYNHYYLSDLLFVVVVLESFQQEEEDRIHQQ